MSKVYVCDRCDQRLSGAEHEQFRLVVAGPGEGLDYDAALHYCTECFIGLRGELHGTDPDDD